MTMATKQEVLKAKLEEYLKADKAGKGRILNHLQAITGFVRKAIVRRLKRLQLSDPYRVDKRGGKEVYNTRVVIALKEVWQIANEICAERLHPQIRELLRVLQRDRMWDHDHATTTLLLQMSLGTMKNIIGGFVKIRANHGKSATKPSVLKEVIPIRRGPWNNPKPGYGEVDTVAHCGNSLSGDYAYSLQYTDVTLIWTCLSAQWNKGQHATLASIRRIKRRLPVIMLGLDPDTGSEFINWLLYDWCKQQDPKVELTRIRPYHKNDHGRIEQKNYVNIRQFLGYTRIADPDKIELMNELYDYLEDYINFFLPSQKCIKKQRIAAKYKRIYDQAQTAYQRALSHPNVPKSIKRELKLKYATLNPKILKEKIERLIKKILNNTHY